MIAKHERSEFALIASIAAFGLCIFAASKACATPVPECAEPSPLCAAMLDYAGRDIRVTPSEAAYECHRVEWWSRKLGGDAALGIASAWIESRFDRDVVSGAGARGVMQVLPRYWCPDRRWRGCDGVRAGVAALVEVQSRYGPVRGVSFYRAGFAGLESERSLSKARERIALAKQLKRAAYGGDDD